MRACEKKKLYKAKCREMVKKGYINDASGSWVPFNANKAMHADQRAGYKL